MKNAKVDKKDQLLMQLAHYFITVENYTPIVVRGAHNEIWMCTTHSLLRFTCSSKWNCHSSFLLLSYSTSSTSQPSPLVLMNSSSELTARMGILPSNWF